MNMGQRIKQLRVDNKLTQEELAEKLGLKKSAVAKYENGRVENIKRSVIQELANILGVTPSYLMGWEDNLNEHTADLTVDLLTNSNVLIHVDRLMSLEEEDKKTIYDMIDFMFNKKKEGL